MPGGMLSISANGNTPGSGILWASHPFNENANQAVVEGIVRAYDASDLKHELWNSKQKPARDDIGNFAKFCPPTVANGKVYMASFSGYLAVYGLLPYQKEVLQETAIGGPALMNMNDTNLSLAWTGTDPQHHLNVALSNDGLTFDRQATLSATSIDGPGFAFGSGLSFLAWTGTNPQHHLNVALSNDGLTFDRQVTLGESSPFGPALAFGNGRLYLAWASTDTNHSLNVLSSIDGVNFTNKVTLGDTSVSAPALSFINGTLYLLWCGRDNNHSLNIMESKDGMTFTNKVTLNDSSDVHPAMVAMIKQSGLLLAWTGRDSKHLLNLRFGGDIHSLSNKLTYMYGEESTAGPALATFNEKNLRWVDGYGQCTSHQHCGSVLMEWLVMSTRVWQTLSAKPLTSQLKICEERSDEAASCLILRMQNHHWNFPCRLLLILRVLTIHRHHQRPQAFPLRSICLPRNHSQLLPPNFHLSFRLRL